MPCRRPWFDSWVRKVPWRRDRLPTPVFLGFPGGSDRKESTCNVGDLRLIPGLGRSPGGGHGSPLQYSCLENPHGQRNLEGSSPWGHMTDWLSTAQLLPIWIWESPPSPPWEWKALRTGTLFISFPAVISPRPMMVSGAYWHTVLVRSVCWMNE